MQELSKQEIIQKLADSTSPIVLFLYAPLCGTCKVTEKMLSIVQAMEPNIPLYKSDLNFIHDLSSDWKVQSVPCLAIFHNGEVIDRIYRMESVQNLLQILRKLI